MNRLLAQSQLLLAAAVLLAAYTPLPRPALTALAVAFLLLGPGLAVLAPLELTIGVRVAFVLPTSLTVAGLLSLLMVLGSPWSLSVLRDALATATIASAVWQLRRSHGKQSPVRPPDAPLGWATEDAP
jgi:hypothetical protein